MKGVALLVASVILLVAFTDAHGYAGRRGPYYGNRGGYINPWRRFGHLQSLYARLGRGRYGIFNRYYRPGYGYGRHYAPQGYHGGNHYDGYRGRGYGVNPYHGQYAGRPYYGVGHNGVHAGKYGNNKAKIAAEKDRAASLGLRHKQGNAAFHKQKEHENLNYDHKISKGSKTEIHIKKQNHHDEHKRINYNRGRALSAGKKQYSDTALDKAAHDKERFVAKHANKHGAHLNGHH